jgi:GGDEF domain-containing protein
MILALIAVVPMLLERIYNEEFDRIERIEVAYKQAAGLAKQGAVAQNEVLVSARALLQAIVSARATFNPSNDDCTALLTKIATPIPWIKTLSVANAQGKIVCSSYSGAIGLDVSERPHFTRPIDSGGFYVGDYIVGSRIKQPAITIALAQGGINGGTSAVVMGLLDLSWFEQAAKTFVPPSGFMLMVDGKGTVLAQYPKDDDLVGRELGHHSLVQAMLAQPEGFVIVPALDGVRRIFGFVQLPGTKTSIAVGLDEKEVVVRANRAMWKAFAATGAVGGLVLLGIWFGGERLLVRPIRAMANTASRIGSGEDKIRAADLPWSTEFVPLAVALDEMAGRLDEREQELRDTNSQLRELAQTDGLTGLPNRRSFNEHLMNEWRLAAKLQQPLAVLMIDVDFFKNFNDHYGHIQGDTCLRKVSGVLKEGTRLRLNSQSLASTQGSELPPSFERIASRARRADFAARYGGEEFAVLLQGADLEAAQRIAERLRQAVEDLLMAHAGAPWGFVSISIGAASVLPAEQGNAEKLTEAADASLYEAKRRGRNCVATSERAILSQVG